MGGLFSQYSFCYTKYIIKTMEDRPAPWPAVFHFFSCNFSVFLMYDVCPIIERRNDIHGIFNYCRPV